MLYAVPSVGGTFPCSGDSSRAKPSIFYQMPSKPQQMVDLDGCFAPWPPGNSTHAFALLSTHSISRRILRVLHGCGHFDATETQQFFCVLRCSSQYMLQRIRKVILI